MGLPLLVLASVGVLVLVVAGVDSQVDRFGAGDSEGLASLPSGGLVASLPGSGFTSAGFSSSAPFALASLTSSCGCCCWVCSGFVAASSPCNSCCWSGFAFSEEDDETALAAASLSVS